MNIGNENSGGNNPAMSEKEKQTLAEKVKVVTQKIAGKKLVVLGITGTVAVAAGIAGVTFFTGTKGENNRQFNPMFSVSGNDAIAEYVTASGTTSLGYTMDEFEPDYIETELYIEEVYLSSGDEVKENTAVFKISQESVEEAREELEEKKEEASLAYRAGLISYEQSKINAKYTYDTAILEGQQAEAVYQNALKDAEEKLQKAKDDVTETEKNIEEYGNAYTSYYYDYHLDTYKERYDQNNIYYHTFLGEYGFEEGDLNGSGMSGGTPSGGGNQSQDSGGTQQGSSQTPDVNQQPEIQQPGNEQGISEDENGDVNEDENETDEEENDEEENDGEETDEEDENIDTTSTDATPASEDTTTEGGNDGTNPAATSLVLSLFSDSNTTLSRLTTSTSLGDGLSLISVSKADPSDENYSRRLKTIQQMKKNMENSQSYYYKAWNEYEAESTKVVEQIPQLKIQLETLKADLVDAETTYQLEVLEAETAYKKSLAQTELAQSDYNAAIQKAEDELEKLEDEKTESQENLEEFEALLGDGYFYTKNAGTIMMVGTRSESNLQGGSMVVAYRNAEDISVTVSVSQDDIHKLSVGDSAQVMVEEYGTYEGKITYLNPVSDSGSRTNITYEVIVDLNGENIGNLKENLTATVIFGYEATR